MNKAERPSVACVNNRNGDPLEVATRQYFYKPLAAFFNAFHLRAYQTARVVLRSPVLDVGCGDGEFGVMLTSVLGEADTMEGLDPDAAKVASANEDARRVYEAMHVGSATDMPFDKDRFRTVVCNASIVSIHPGLDTALDGISALLEPGESFYATACTAEFEQHYWVAQLLTYLRMPGLARRYKNALNRRMQQVHLCSPDEWVDRFEKAGLKVKQHFGFFPTSHVFIWSILAWTPLRVLGVSKLIPWPGLHRALSRFYAFLLRGIYERTPTKLPPDECGYIFIEAVKE